jgi:hypothetical protein
MCVERIPLPGDQRTSYERPSVARDALGRIWISAIAVRGNIKTIRLYVIEGAKTPRRVNRRFGLSNRYYQRSARLLRIPGGVMMVFSDDPAKDNQEYTLNFTQRLDTLPLGAAWTPAKQILHYHNEPDDNGAHFVAPWTALVRCTPSHVPIRRCIISSWRTATWLPVRRAISSLPALSNTHRLPLANRTPCTFSARLSEMAAKLCRYFRAPTAESPFTMTTI